MQGTMCCRFSCDTSVCNMHTMQHRPGLFFSTPCRFGNLSHIHPPFARFKMGRHKKMLNPEVNYFTWEWTKNDNVP